MQRLKKENSIPKLEACLEQVESQILGLKAEFLNRNQWTSKDARLKVLRLEIELKEIKTRLRVLKKRSSAKSKNKILLTVISSLVLSKQKQQTNTAFYERNRELISDLKKEAKANRRVNAEVIAEALKTEDQGKDSILDELNRQIIQNSTDYSTLPKAKI